MEDVEKSTIARLKVDNKIEIVYRIAVLQNESALLRSGYNNIIPNLQKITKHFSNDQSGFRETYEFKSFTSLNINGLFLQHSKDFIDEFDALVIATNATNDNEILARLNENSTFIDNFIAANKGIAIFSQKKISSSPDGMVGFLPMELSYKLIERTDNKDSAKGNITTIKIDDWLMKDASDETINERCNKNPFKPHKYRSYLRLLNEGFYEKLLFDKENSVDQVPILLARCRSKKIVVTSMALDQTEQNELLKNILNYIIKGIPSIAFVGVKEQAYDFTNTNFNNLYYTTKLAKYATQDFESFSQITTEKMLYNVYIVSPSIPKATVADFWNQLKVQTSGGLRKNLKIYRIEESVGNEKIIQEFSNYSSVDLIIDKALLWITSTFDVPIASDPEHHQVNESYFGNSFWISYDALQLLYDVLKSNKYAMDEVYLSFLVPILNKIAHKHFRQEDEPSTGSYDGVYNCSCAMLEIFASFKVSDLKKEQYGKEKFYSGINPKLTSAYVIDNFDEANIDDKLYAVLSLRYLYEEKHQVFKKKHQGTSVYDKMISVVYEELIEPYNDSNAQQVYERYNEIDICRQIRFIALVLEIETIDDLRMTFLQGLLYNHILRLYSTQVNGKWQSVSKTAIVLKTLIRCVSRNNQITDSDLLLINNLTVTKAINYLMSGYNDIGDSWGNWENDLLASISATHALLLYDLSNNYTIKDFKDSIAKESLHISTLDTTVNHIRALATLRNNNSKLYLILNKALEEKDVLAGQVISLNKDISASKEKFADDKKKYEDKYEWRLTFAFIITIGCVFLYLFEKFKLFDNLSGIVQMIFSFVLTGGVTSLVKYGVDLKRDKKGSEDREEGQ